MVIDLVLIIVEQICLYLPLVIGAYITFSLMKIPSFSIEAAFITGAIFAHKVLIGFQGLNQMQSLMLAVVASLIGGALLGVIVSTIHRVCKIPALLANVVTVGIGYGVNIFFMGGGGHVSMPGTHNPLITSLISKHPELPILMLLSGITLVVAFLFGRTQLGISAAVYGNNPRFFSFYNISTTHIVFCSLMIVNALAGLSGYFVAQASSFIDINGGVGVFLFCITSIILGKVATFFVRNPISMAVPVTGVALYCLLQQLLLKVGFNLKYFTVVQACIVLIVLAYHFRNRSEHDGSSDELGV